MAEEKRKKKRGRAYLNDFRVNVAGEYVYTGKIYVWKSDRKKALWTLWLYTGGALALAVLAGCIPDTGMEGAVWALLPYAISLIGAMTCVYAVIRLTAAGETLREYVYDAAVNSLPGRCCMTEIFSLAAIVGNLINLFLPSYAGELLSSGIFISLECGVLVLTRLLRRTSRELIWQEI